MASSDTKPSPSVDTANQTPSDDSAGTVAYAWLAAWTVMLTLLWALNRTRIGHIVVYYLLVLMIVLLLVTSAGTFAEIFKPFTDAVTGQGAFDSGQGEDLGANEGEPNRAPQTGS